MRKSALLATATSAAVTFCCLMAIGLAADYPQWWIDSGVVNQQATVNDYAAANAGQLKWMATKAADHLDAGLPGGAGPEVTDLVTGFLPVNNYQVINLGQLKNVAKPLYDRLIEEGYTDSYPWTETTADDVNYAVANLGQMKTVFNFDLLLDTDEDGLADWWETMHFGGLTGQTGQDDPDEDGLANCDELSNATDPQDADTDDDTLPDGWECRYGLNPHDSGDVGGDPDGDTLTNLQEYQKGLSPIARDYRLEIETVTHGSVTGGGNGNWYPSGTALILTAMPDQEYYFIRWSGDVPVSTETDNPVQLTMDRNRTITPEFGAITDDLLVHYTFETSELQAPDPIPDHSGNDRDGTMMAMWTAYGQIGGACDDSSAWFTHPDGIESHPHPLIFLQGTDPDWMPTEAEPITVSAWIKWDGQYGAGGYGTILSYFQQGRGFHFGVQDLDGGNRLTLSFDGWLGGAPTRTYTPNHSIAADTWYHVAFTWDSGHTVLYINGAKAAEGGQARDFYAHSTSAPCTGMNPGGGNVWQGGWLGVIDEVRIYGQALSKLAILAIYEKENQIDGPSWNELVIDRAPPSGTIISWNNGGGSGTYATGTHSLPAQTDLTAAVPAHYEMSDYLFSDGVRNRCTGYCFSSPGTEDQTGTENECTFSLPEPDGTGNDSSLKWNWQKEYLLDTGVQGSGSVNIDDSWYSPYASVTLTASHGGGHEFVGWVGDVPAESVADPEIQISMDQPRRITALFEPVPYELTVVSAYGEGDPGVGRHTYVYDTSINCVMNTPLVTIDKTQWACTGWIGTDSVPATGTGTETGPFNIQADSSITWQWAIANCYLTLDTRRNGSVSHASGWYPKDSVQSLQATPATSYVFKHWDGDFAGAPQTANPLDLTVSQPYSVIAVFDYDMSLDVDGDLLPTGWEVENDLDDSLPDGANGDNGATGDPDGDGLTNLEEFTNPEERGGRTDPNSVDSDGDGLWDNVETGTGNFVDANDTGTNPNDVDSDADGLRDNVKTGSGIYADANDTGTDPTNEDTDNDGLKDGVETCTGTYVGVSDTGTSPHNTDSDGDSLTDYEETHLYHTDPNTPDTDGDGLPDDWEVENGSQVILDDDFVPSPDSRWAGFDGWESKNWRPAGGEESRYMIARPPQCQASIDLGQGYSDYHIEVDCAVILDTSAEYWQLPWFRIVIGNHTYLFNPSLDGTRLRPDDLPGYVDVGVELDPCGQYSQGPPSIKLPFGVHGVGFTLVVHNNGEQLEAYVRPSGTEDELRLPGLLCADAPLTKIGFEVDFHEETVEIGFANVLARTLGVDALVADDPEADDDRDGLNALAEAHIGSSEGCWDTDGDGMGDGWEYRYMKHLENDPNVPPDPQYSPPWLDATFPGASSDQDGDGTDNLYESKIMWHGQEISCREPYDWPGTDPFYWDTDGDLISDSDEMLSGPPWNRMDAADPNGKHGTSGPNADFDDDGLSNIDELRLAGLLGKPNSDNGGDKDGAEAEAGDYVSCSDPSGTPVPVKLTVGDHLNDPAPSERYRLVVADEQYSPPRVFLRHQHTSFAGVGSKTYNQFRVNRDYSITVEHIATARAAGQTLGSPPPPDFDYTAGIELDSAAADELCLIIKDQDDLLGPHAGTTNPGSKAAVDALIVAGIKVWELTTEREELLFIPADGTTKAQLEVVPKEGSWTIAPARLDWNCPGAAVTPSSTAPTAEIGPFTQAGVYTVTVYNGDNPDGPKAEITIHTGLEIQHLDARYGDDHSPKVLVLGSADYDHDPNYAQLIIPGTEGFNDLQRRLTFQGNRIPEIRRMGSGEAWWKPNNAFVIEDTYADTTSEDEVAFEVRQADVDGIWPLGCVADVTLEVLDPVDQVLDTSSIELHGVSIKMGLPPAVPINDDYDEGKNEEDKADEAPTKATGGLALDELVPVELIAGLTAARLLHQDTEITLTIPSGVRVFAVKDGSHEVLPDDGSDLRADFFAPDGDYYDATFYVEGIALGAQQLELKYTYGSPASETDSDTGSTLVFKLNLFYGNLGEEYNEVPHEEDPGAFVQVNKNDNDGVNGIDRDWIDPLPQQDTDLVLLEVSFVPSVPSAGTVTLTRPDNALRLWTTQEKAAVVPEQWELLLPNQKSAFESILTAGGVWIEGTANGDGFVELAYDSISEDKVKTTVIGVDIKQERECVRAKRGDPVNLSLTDDSPEDVTWSITPVITPNGAAFVDGVNQGKNVAVEVGSQMIEYTIKAESDIDPQFFDTMKLKVYGYDKCAVSHKEADSTEPVNLINGNMNFHETDIHVPCPGMPLTFVRHYNSRFLELNADFNQGWTHSLEWRLNTVLDETYRGVGPADWRVLLTGDGNSHWFRESGGAYLPPPDVAMELNGNMVTLPGGTTCTFSGQTGRLTEMAEPNGNKITLTYDSGDPRRIKYASHSNGLRLKFGYTTVYGMPRIEKVEVQDENGAALNLEMTYAYSQGGFLESATRHTSAQAGNEVTTYTYETGTACLTKRTNPLGHEFTYEYDCDPPNAVGQVWALGTDVKVLDGQDDYYTHTAVHGSGQSTVTYDREDELLTLVYQFEETEDRLTSISGPAAGNSTTYNYESPDNRTDIEDLRVEDAGTGKYVNSHTAYNTRHRPMTTRFDYSGTGSAWTYDWAGGPYDNLNSITDPRSCVVSFGYSVNRLSEITEGTYTTRWLYDDADTVPNDFSQPIWFINANDCRIAYKYDDRGFLKELVPHEGAAGAFARIGPRSVYTRDDLGNIQTVTVVSEDDQTSRTWTIDTDELGRVNGIQYPDLGTESFIYDVMGNLTEHTSRGGAITKYEYLPTRRLTKVTRDAGGLDEAITRFDYDKQMNTLTVIDPRNRAVETYDLDLMDRPETIWNVDGQTMTVTYEVDNYVDQITRFDNSTVSFDYDSDGRLDQVQYQNETIGFTYLDNGLLDTATRGATVIDNTWSTSINRLESTDGADPAGEVTYSYKPAGQVESVSAKGGALTRTYVYDGGDRLDELQAQVSVGTFDYEYNGDNGMVEAVTFPNGITATYKFDDLDRVESIAWRDTSTGNAFRSFDYDYGSDDLICRVTKLDGSKQEYCYDGLGRLTDADAFDAAGTQTDDKTYTYDLAGNRTEMTDDGVGTVAYNYVGNGNRLDTWGIGGTGSAYAHDNAGNITQIVRAQGSTYDLAWNDLYEVTSVDKDGTTVEGYEYDALGRRFKITADGTDRYCVYDGIHPLAEVNSSGSLIRSYTWGPGIDNLLAMTDHLTDDTYCMLTDHLGTVHAVVNSSGSVVESYHYDAWGRVLGVYDSNGQPLSESAIGNNYLWQGRCDGSGSFGGRKRPHIPAEGIVSRMLCVRWAVMRSGWTA